MPARKTDSQGNLFKVDTSAFANKVTKKPRAPKKPRQVSLEEALERLKAEGYTVEIPNKEEIKEKQEESTAKLGIKTKGRPKAVKTINHLTFNLNFPHNVNESTFGPGVVNLTEEDLRLTKELKKELSKDQIFERLVSLKNSLLHSDHIAQAQQTEVLLPRTPRAYMIFGRETANGRTNVPVRMNDNFFDNPENMNNSQVIHSEINSNNASIFHEDYLNRTQSQGRLV